MRTLRPTTPASPPKRRFQSSCVRTMTAFLPGWSSSGAKVRPSTGWARSTESPLGDILRPPIRSGSPSPARLSSPGATAAIDSKAVVCRAQSRKTPTETELPWPGLEVSQTWTTCPGSSNGSGRSSTASTTLNIAVFAPIPRASVSTAAAVNPGAFRSCRRASFKSAGGVMPFGRPAGCRGLERLVHAFEEQHRILPERRGLEELLGRAGEDRASAVARGERHGVLFFSRDGADPGGLRVLRFDLVQVEEDRGRARDVDEDAGAVGGAHRGIQRALAADARSEDTLVGDEVLPGRQRRQDALHQADLRGARGVEGLVPVLFHAPHLVLAVGVEAAGHHRPPGLSAHDERRDRALRVLGAIFVGTLPEYDGFTRRAERVGKDGTVVLRPLGR